MQKLVTHWHIRSYCVRISWFLLGSIALTVSNSVPASVVDCWVGRINVGTFGAALTSRCCGQSGSSMSLSCSISDWTSAAQSSLWTFALSQSTFQSSQLSFSTMLPSALSSSVSTGWRLIHLIRRTFNIWVCPPGRSFVDNAGSKDDVSDN